MRLAHVSISGRGETDRFLAQVAGALERSWLAGQDPEPVTCGG